MSAEIQFDSEIQWDGNHLLVWAVNNGARILCRISRATIHAVPLFGDVLTREIARDRVEIFDRLRAALTAKIVQQSTGPVELQPTDLTA
jgi:Protein of unknown function (DUF1488)